MTIRMEGIEYTMECECCGTKATCMITWDELKSFVCKAPASQEEFEDGFRNWSMANTCEKGWATIEVDGLMCELCSPCNEAYRCGNVTPTKKVVWSHNDIPEEYIECEITAED